MLNVSQQRDDDGTVTAFVEGSINSTTAKDFEVKLKAIAANANVLVIDLGAVKYMSSAGLRTLLVLHKLMKPKGGMKLANVNEYVYEIFEFTGFDFAFNIISRI